MGSRHRIVPVLAAITVLVAALPSVAQAFPQNGGTETAQLTMGPNQIGTARTDALPSKVTKARIKVTLESDDTQFFDTLTEILSSKGSFGARAVACVIMAGYSKDNLQGFQIEDPTLQLLFLDVCIHVAAHLPQQPSAGGPPMAASSAGTACVYTRKAIGTRISHSGSGYTANVSGRTYTPKGRSPLKISCKRSGHTLLIKLRPRSKKRTLKQAVGSELGIGFDNRTNRSGRLQISFTVK